jgi:hypothetical protein
MGTAPWEPATLKLSDSAVGGWQTVEQATAERHYTTSDLAVQTESKNPT